MLKRCLSPLTLVNQVALIVLLSTAIGLAGMAVSGWLVQGVQGSAHAINKAGSLRMQSYRLLAAVPLNEKDKPLIKEMEQTAFSAELTRAAERDGQLAQLQGLQDYWRNELIPALMRAQNRETVSADVSQFVAGLINWYLVLTAPRKCASRQCTGPSGNGGIYGTFTGVHYYLVAGATATTVAATAGNGESPSVIAILPNAQTSAGATKWRCLELCEQYVCRTGRKLCPYLSSGFRRKPPGWSIKIRSSLFMAG